MGNVNDKFARLAALKRVRAVPPRASGLRMPDETDALGRLLGAGIARNPYGEHLAIRNWFATPEFSEPSKTALDLLTRANGKTPARKSERPASTSALSKAVSDPERWLFLDT